MTLPATFADLQSGGGVMVHLPRLRWRADHSLDRLREAGFRNIVLEEGVDASTTDVRAIAERHGWFFDPGINGGEIGCAVSMLRLWQRVVDDDLPYLLVFEDDVLPHPDVARIGVDYWEQTPDDAELVLMGNQMWPADLAALPDPHQLVVPLPAYCLHAYVITNAGARRALDLVAAKLAGDRWLRVLDMEVRGWMARGDVRAVCWNGTDLDPSFESVDDVARESCGATGVFWQNETLGSSIWPGGTGDVASGARQGARPRAVLVSAWAPSLSGNGSAIRAGVALEALAHDHDVDLVLAASYGPVAADHWAARLARAVHVLPLEVADPFLWRLDLMSESEQQRARVVYPRPVAAAFSTREAAAAVVDAVGDDVDLFYVFRAFAAPLAEPWLVDDETRPRFVLDVDEDDERTLRQIASMQRASGDDAWAAVSDADAGRLSAMAAEWIPRADLVLAAGPEEVGRLRSRYPEATVDLLPNPTPPTGDDGPADETDILFVGTCSYPPNVDAARWLCVEVLPVLRRRLGRRVKVAVVGSTMVDSVSALAADPDVTVVADVPSVTPWYRATKIAVAPLRAGGGTRLKILEAFGHRRPVVSTSQGAEGLSVTPGVDIVVGNTTEEFASACAELLGDADRRAALASAAVQIAVAHARPAIVDRLAGMLAGREVVRADA